MSIIQQFTSYLETPVGCIEISADEKSISAVSFMDEKQQSIIEGNIISEACKQQLSEYFSGTRNTFDIPLNLCGTDFQNRVWKALQQIPFGKTISYLQLAKNLGDPKCIRAAGTANGKNPFAIIVPCHRVIGSKGDLIGYAGGLWRKQWLLKHENKLANGVNTLF